jgi:hypothetical protein
VVLYLGAGTPADEVSAAPAEGMDASMADRDVTWVSPVPSGLAALGGDRVTERKLSINTTETTRGVLIRIATKRTDATDRYFPEITANGYIVSYNHVDSLTAEQAEFVVSEIIGILQSFDYEERKLKNGGPGRPSLIKDDDSEVETNLKTIAIKRKQMRKALDELCKVFSIDNPLETA